VAINRIVATTAAGSGDIEIPVVKSCSSTVPMVLAIHSVGCCASVHLTIRLHDVGVDLIVSQNLRTVMDEVQDLALKPALHE